jgi:MFS family permease
MSVATDRPIELGLAANVGQFVLLVGVNALVGGMVGQERTVLPLLASDLFGVSGFTAILTYLLAFGLTKAGANLLAGLLSDRFGRKRILLVGWLVGLPVPLLLIWAPSWTWVVVANVFLGLNQGLTWSTTVIMKIDLVGPRRRGLAMGLNEAAGYGAVAVTALLTGVLAERFGLRPTPFLLGLTYAGLGLTVSALLVRETAGHAALEPGPLTSPGRPGWRSTFLRATFREPSLSAACQAGLVNNLNDGMVWGLLPIFFATAGLSTGQIGVLAAVYPAVWAAAQIGTGAWSDRVGRKRLIVAGLLVQAGAIAAIAAGSGFAGWLVAAVVLGFGTALVYPTLLAVVGDVADPAWRGSAIGIYRLWRDLGFAAGAIVVGVIADAAGMTNAIWVVAAITGSSALVVAVRMRETLPRLTTPLRG